MKSHLTDINIKLRQTEENAFAQSLTCPSTLLLEPIDKLLEDFVFMHQRRYTRRINCYIAQLKAQVRDSELWQKLSSCQMNIEQVK